MQQSCLSYFMPQIFFQNKNVPKQLRLRLKSTTIDRTLTYASETGTLTERDRKQLNIFERKMYMTMKKKLEDINQ
jgi:hypothetical protein